MQRYIIFKRIKQLFTSKTQLQEQTYRTEATSNKQLVTHAAQSIQSASSANALSYQVRLKASQYGIYPRSIPQSALSVVSQLKKHGYEAYVVGGCLRDLLLAKTPKDFDVATNASPEQIKKVFQRRCRLIGRRFRLAHIMFGREIIEVATFRGSHSNEHTDDVSRRNADGLLLRDNVYGSLEEDAKRRDFTVNALYYDPENNVLIDYFNGIDDIQKGKLSLIGNPEIRYQEDPVRILRAIRFMAKLDMFLEQKSETQIPHYAHLLSQIPSARLFDESLKLLQSGYGLQTYKLLRQYNLVQYLFPNLVPYFTQQQDSLAEKMIDYSLRSTDERIHDNLRVNPAFMFAAFFWYPLREKIELLKNEASLNNFDAFNIAASDMLSDICKALSIPKRHTATIREIWFMQLQLPRRNGNQADKTFARPKFRAGFDLLAMRAELEGGELIALTQWWHEYQQSNPPQRQSLIQDFNKQNAAPKKRRPYRNRKRNKSGEKDHYPVMGNKNAE